MSLASSTLCSPHLSLKPRHLASNLSLQTRRFSRTRDHVIPFRSSSFSRQRLTPDYAHSSFRFPASNLGFGFSIGTKQGFRAGAENGEGEGKSVVGEGKSVVDKAEEEARGQSTMPERFRHLSKEAPDRPVRWPWFLALAFLLYAWRTVLWELSNWKKVVVNIVLFMGYLSKLAVALIFHFIGDPITSLIRGLETTLYNIRAFYSAVLAYTPVPELTVIIMLVAAVFAIAEAVVPNSVDNQPYLLTLAGIFSFAVVRGSISELFFWVLLLGLFGFARFIKKRDYVSSLLPVAAALAAVGEPWVRVVAITSYLGLAITYHSRNPPEYKDEDEASSVTTGTRVPIPLLCAALAIGVRVAAKWAGYRHLTWMIV